MGPGIVTSIRPRREQLRWLSLIFRLAIRLKIVAELYMRPMSPKEFYSEFGGGSLSRVAKQFAILEKHGALRRVGPRGRTAGRPGPSETLFRATEAPFLDAEMWALLPYSIRLISSWNLFKATAKELREGIEAAAFEGRQSRDLTCTPLELDGLGWARVIGALDSHFESVFAQQEDAKLRVMEGSGNLLRVGVLQIGFESPRGADLLALDLADGTFEPLIPFPERLAPVFADDLFLLIVQELNRRSLSVPQFHREFASDISEGAVRHRFNRARKLGLATIVERVPKRGAEEHLYRATKPAVDDGGAWADAPDALAETETWATFEKLSTLVKESIVAGTFDVRDDRHLSWSIVSLDQEGLTRVTAGIEALDGFIREEQERARKRIEAGAESLSMVVGLSVVESPISSVRVP